jgi:hypothetical protein
MATRGLWLKDECKNREREREREKKEKSNIFRPVATT